MERYVLPATAVLLVAIGVWFAFRQNRVLRKLREEPHMSPEDQKYFRRMVWRRWLGSALLIVLAVMLGGLFGMGILDKLDELRDLGPQAQAGQRQLTPEERDFLLFGVNYVLILLLVLLLTVGVAVVDLMAIRRYGMRHRRRLREDRQAMLDRQLPQLYQERRLRQRGLDVPGDEETPPQD